MYYIHVYTYIHTPHTPHTHTHTDRYIYIYKLIIIKKQHILHVSTNVFFFLRCGNTYISDGNYDYFTLLLSGNPSTIFLRLRNSTDHSRVKSSTYENHGNDETRTHKP